MVWCGGGNLNKGSVFSVSKDMTMRESFRERDVSQYYESTFKVVWEARVTTLLSLHI